MVIPNFFVEYKGRDNYKLRVFLALLKHKSHGYELATKFRGYNKFATEITLPNKISTHIKEMRAESVLTEKQQNNRIIVEANQNILKTIAEWTFVFDTEKAADMFSDISQKLGLAFNPSIKTFRDCLDLVLYYLWDICINRKGFTKYSPLVALLALTPTVKEKGNMDMALHLSTKARYFFKGMTSDAQKYALSNGEKHRDSIQKYLIKNKANFQDFLKFIADCLEALEWKHIEMGTAYKDRRLLSGFQIGAVKLLLNNFKVYEAEATFGKK